MEALRNLGLTKYEAATYATLLKLGPADARRIAKASGVPPTAVYPNLKTLMSKSLVQQLRGDIALYEALDPKIALPALAEKQREERERQVNDALAQLQDMKKDPLAAQEPVSVFEGHDTSHQIFSAFAKNTSKSLLIMGWGFSITTYAIRNVRAIAEITKRGKEVRLITTNPDHAKNPLIKQLKEIGVQVRYFPIKNFSIIIRDKEECKITLKNRELRQHTNLHVHDKDFTAALCDYYLSIWKKAKKV